MRNITYNDSICGRGLTDDERARIIDFHTKFIKGQLLYKEHVIVAHQEKIIFNEIRKSLKMDDGCDCIGVIGNSNTDVINTWRRYFKRRPGYIQPTPASWGYFIHFRYEDMSRFKLMVSSFDCFSLVLPTNNETLKKLLLDY